MKQKFSTKWQGSKKPRKQRKYIANAPIHIKKKLLSSNLAKDLRKKYNKRSVPIRKEDNVRVMVGSFKGKIGKVGVVNRQKMKITIEGITRTKKDGTKINVYFSPSNVQIKELNLNDKKRIKAIERKNIVKETVNKEKKQDVSKKK